MKSLIALLIAVSISNVVVNIIYSEPNEPEMSYINASIPEQHSSLLDQLIESIPTWPEYYEVQEDIYMKNPAYTTINMDGVIIDSQEGCYSIWIEKGTKICKGKPENSQ